MIGGAVGHCPAALSHWVIGEESPTCRLPCYDAAMIRRLDLWIGTRLFHPPIIWLCQRTGLTQHAVSRYAWMIATLTFPARIGSGPEYTGAGYIAFSICMGVMITAATPFLANVPTRPLFGFRLIIWGIALAQVIAQAVHPRVAPDTIWAMSWTVLALTAEYAKTITTVPPRKRRERRTAAKEAFS